MAEESKCQNYQHLLPTHCFTPISFDSLGAVGRRYNFSIRPFAHAMYFYHEHFATQDARATGSDSLQIVAIDQRLAP